MPITAVLGEQRGDEGKGRFVDMLAEEHDIVARFNGGPNAGHTVVLPDGLELNLHLLPSGIAHPEVVNVIGSGALLNAASLVKEIDTAATAGIELTKGNLKISGGAHLILPAHISADEIREAGTGRQGTTKAGIAQCAADKYLRVGVRAETIKNNPDELFLIVRDGLLAQKQVRKEAGLEALDEEAAAKAYVESARKLGRFVTDTAFYLNQQLATGSRVLAEGAQAFLLDIDHGMYPYTTSSSPMIGGVATGLGVAPTHINRVVGVAKAVQSHVGGGPFVSEITDPKVLASLHGDMGAIDAERGTTTGRTRRLGYFDLPAVRRAQMINGTSEMALTKLDWVPRFAGNLAICTAYERKGRILEIAPDAAYKLKQSTPILEQLPNWEEDIRSVRKFEELPANAQNFIRFIEERTKVRVTMIGVGPKRDQVIVR